MEIYLFFIYIFLFVLFLKGFYTYYIFLTLKILIPNKMSLIPRRVSEVNRQKIKKGKEMMPLEIVSQRNILV